MGKLFRLWSVLVFVVVSYAGFGQSRTTSQPGPWNNTATWGGQSVPDATFGTITINHAVNVPSGYLPGGSALQIDQTTIGNGGTLTVDAGAQLYLNAGTGVDLIISGTGQLVVSGRLISEQAVTTTTTALNANFLSGSIYEHQHTSAAGNLITATWNINSTVEITGYTGSVTGNATWSQAIGNLTYNCASQAAGTVNFAGFLTNIGGNLTILNTGATGILSLSSTQTFATTIGGNVSISGLSRFRLTTTGSATVTVGGSFTYNSSHSSAANFSQNGTTGVGVLQINNGNDFNLQGGFWNFTSGNGAVTQRIVLNGGDFIASGGTLQETNTNTTALGRIEFQATTAVTQQIDLDPTLIQAGSNITVLVNSTNAAGQVDMLSDLTVSALTMTDGTLNINGSALTINGPVTRTSGDIQAFSSSSFFLGGTAGASVANFVDGSALSTLEINSSGATLSSSGTITVATLNLFNGTLTHTGSLTIEDGGLIDRRANTAILTNAPAAAGQYDVTYNNAGTITTNFNELPASSSVLNDLTKAGASSVTLPASLSLTINGDLLVAAGTLTGNTNQNITLNGNFSSGGTASNFGQAGSTFTFAGPTAALSGSVAPTFTNLVIASSAVLTPSVGYRVNGNYTVQNNATVNAGSGIVTFGGTTVITNNGTMNLNAVTINTGNNMTAPATTMGIAGNFTSTGTFTHGGGTILFNGTSNLTASEVYNNITISGGVTSSGNFTQTVAGSMVNNGTFNISSIATGGNLTWSGSGTLSGTGNTTVADVNVSGTSFTFTGSGNLTLNDDALGAGTFNASGASGTVIFAGAASALSGSINKSFRNISVTGTLTPGVAYNLANTGTFDVGGTLTAGAGAVTFGGTTTLQGAGAIRFDVVTITGTLNSSAGNITLEDNFTNNGVFNHNGGTVTFGTTGAQKLIGGSNAITFNNLVINTNTGNPDVRNSNTTGINVVGRVTFPTAAILDVDGAGNNLAFTLLSTADNSTTEGSFGPLLGGASVSGSFTAQRHMDSESRVWRYISSPVVGATVATLKAAFPVSGTFTDPSACPLCPPGYNPASPSVYFYNAATQAYVAYPSSGLASANALTNGVGYSAYVRQDGLAGPATINFTGTHPSTAGFSLPVASAANGFALVGNPYPSAILWDPAGAGYTGTTNIVTTVKIRNNGTGGPVFVDVLPGDIIAAGQSFWVTTSAAGGGVLNINENAKTASASTFYRLDNTESDELLINAAKITSGDIDVTRLRIQAGSLANYDNFDSKKWDNAIQGGTNKFDLSTLTADGNSVSTNSVPAIDCNQSAFALRLNDVLDQSPTTTPVQTTAQYSFSIDQNGAMRAMSWILHDSKTNNDINLSQTPNYQFTVDLSEVTVEVVLNGSGNPTTARRYHLPNRFTISALSAAIDQSLSVASASQVCESSSTAITISSSQLNMMYGVEVNGTTYYPNLAQGTGSDLNIPIESEWLASGANTVKVKANSGCDAQFLTATSSITKEELLTAAATTVTSCQPSSITLSASGAANTTNYKWYASETSSTVLATGDKFETPVLTADSTSYFVTALNSQGCEGSRTLVTAYIKDVVDFSIEPGSPEVCSEGMYTLTATAQKGVNGTFTWYDTPTSAEVLLSKSTTASDSISTFTIPSLAKTKKYYVSFTNGNGCESKRMETLAQVANFSAVVGAESLLGERLICPNGSHTFRGTGAPANSTYAWYKSLDASTPVFEGDEFTTEPLTSTTSYYVAAKSELGCFTSRSEVIAKVDLTNPSTGIAVTLEKICKEGTVQINVTGGTAGATYNWYDGVDAVHPVSDGSQFSTDNLKEDRSYYVSAVNSNGCEGYRLKVDVKILNYADPVITMLTPTTLQSNWSTGNQWYLNGDILAGETNQTIELAGSGEYGLKVTIENCEAWTSGEYLVTGLEDLSRTIEVYPNPTSEILYVKIVGNEKVGVTFLDAKGALMMPVNLTAEGKGWQTALDVRGLAKGLYFLRIFSETKSVTHKVIIK